MSSSGMSLSLVLGASLGAGWVSSFAKANGSVSSLGEKLKGLQDQQRRAPRLNIMGAKDTRGELQKSRNELAALQAQKDGGDNSQALASRMVLLGNRINTLSKSYQKQREVLARTRNDMRAKGIDTRQAARDYELLKRRIDAGNAAMQAQANLAKSKSSLLWSLGRGLVVFGAIYRSTFRLTNSAANVGDELAKTSARLGLSTQALQEYRYAAQLAGVEQANLDNGLKDLNLRIGKAMMGQGEAVKMAQRYGVNLNTLATMSADEQLAAVADVMKDMTTTAEQAAFANAFLGESGVKMINMLKGGAEGLAKARSEAQKYDYIFTKEDARNSETFKDSLTRLSTSFRALKNAVGVKLMPALSAAFDKVAKSFADNRDAIVKGLSGIAKTIGETIPFFVKAFGTLLNLFGKAPGAIYAGVVALAAFGAALVTIKLVRFGADLFDAAAKLRTFTITTIASENATRAAGAAQMFYGKTTLFASTNLRALRAGMLMQLALLKSSTAATKLHTFWLNAQTAAQTRSALAGARLGKVGKGVAATKIGGGMLSGIGKVFTRLLGWTGLLGGLFVKLAGAGKLAFGGLAAIVGVAAAKFILIGALIAGVAYLIYRNWEPIKKFFMNLHAMFMSEMQPAINMMKKAWENVLAAVTPLMPVFKFIGIAILGVFYVVFRILVALFVVKFAIITKIVTGILYIFSAVFRAITWLVKTIVEGWVGLFGLIGDVLEMVFGHNFIVSVKEAFGEVIGWISDQIEWLADKVGKVLRWLGFANDEADDAAAKTQQKQSGSSTAKVTSASAQNLTALNPPPLQPANNTRAVTVNSAPVVNVYAQPGMSEEDIGRIAARDVERRQNDILSAALFDF